MAEIIRMPRMSDTMEEGNIVGWQKAEGEEVEAGDLLAEIETDKATMDFDAPFDGVLLHIAVKEGPVPIGGVIAIIGEQGEDWQTQLKEANQEQAPTSVEENTPAPQPEATNSTPAIVAADQRIKASPLAKNIAKDSGVDLAAVTGSGDHGRIVKRDIEAFLKANQSTKVSDTTPAAPVVSEPKPAAPVAKDLPTVEPFLFDGSTAQFEEQAVSQMRKVIARRLGESKFSAPHFYLTVEINMDKVMAMRKRVNEVAPTKISFNDFIVKGAAAALKQHPMINASWQESTIRINKQINIGVAVAIDEGLLVPVVKHANMKTLSQINAEVKAYAAKAKARKLQPDEMQGNTFTISNLGMFGIEEFTAIINPPDACILAVGGIVKKPIVKDDNIVVGHTMKVTLSCDHRVVDGATGAKFLQTFKDIIEDPVRLMV